MQKQKISFDLAIYDSQEELPEEYKNLMSVAHKSRLNAYAPYSNFQVGAAVLLDNDEIVIGNNQENASFPSGLCAERVAIFQAGALFPGVPVKAIAVSAASGNVKLARPAAPCGNCRQAIAEYEQKQPKPIKIFMMGETGQVYAVNSLTDLLPLTFGNSYLI
ncbi:MAG: cytidine deaminase [Flavobacteriaceae bacterium]